MIPFMLNIVFALISVALYIWAPEGYSLPFCQTMLGIFLLQNAAWLVFGAGKRRLRFELFFMISFLFVNFIYPTVYADVFPHWFMFNHGFNRHVINQATALAYMAYAFYMLGVQENPWRQYVEPCKPTFTIRPSYMMVLCVVALLSFMLFVVSGGYTALSNVYSGGGNLRDVGLFSYFNNIFSISALLLAAFVFHVPTRYRLPLLGVLGVFMLLLLSTGSRQLSISIVLVLMVSFSLHVYRLHAWQVVVLVLMGVVALFGIMLMREHGISSDSLESGLSGFEQFSVFDAFSDLIINNLNLYVLVDYGNRHDLTWLQGVLIDLASPIPKLGTALIDSTDQAHELFNGGELPSYLLLGRGAGWGIGTNMIGELFRSFGAIGTCIFMYGLGRLLRAVYYSANSNIFCYAFYMLMVGHAVIYPRGPFLYDPRTVVWAMLLLWLVKTAVDRYHRVFASEKNEEETL